MSNQDAFEKACKGIIAQGGLSMTKDSCAYRGDDERKCAIGHLLTDEQIQRYNLKQDSIVDNFSGDLLRELRITYGLEKPATFLDELQGLHDNFTYNDDFVSGFTLAANEFAAKWNLQPLT